MIKLLLRKFAPVVCISAVLVILLCLPAAGQEKKKAVIIPLNDYSKLIRELGDRVLLPLDEYNHLLEKLSLAKAAQEPGETVTIESVLYSFTPEGLAVHGEAVITASFLKPGWHLLCDAESAVYRKLESITIGDVNGKFLKDGDMLYIYSPRQGRSVIHIKFYLDIDEDSNGRLHSATSVLTGLNTVSRVELPVNTGDYTFSGATIISSDQQTGIRAVLLQNTSKYFSFSWNGKPKAADTGLRIEPRMISSVSSLFVLSKGFCSEVDIIGIQVQKGSQREFRILLNGKLEINEIICEGIEFYSSKKENEKTVLTVVMSKPVSDSVIFLLRSEIPGNASNAEFIPPVVSDSSRQNGFIAISSDDPVSFRDAGSQSDYSSIDTRELPGEIRKMGDSEPLLGFQYRLRHNEMVKPLHLSYDFYPAFNTLTGFAVKADAMTLFGPDGSYINRIIYTMNTTEGSFRLKLNPGSTLLSAFDGGLPANASVEGEEIIIPLKSSGSDMIRNVEVVVLSKAVPFEKKGKMEIKLPSVNVTVKEFVWNLYLPEEYDYDDWDGNVSSGVIAYVPEAIVTAAAKIAGYSKGDVSDYNVPRAVTEADSKTEPYLVDGVSEITTKTKTFKDADTPSSGKPDLTVFSSSLKIIIPVEGRPFKFSSLLLTGDKPELSFEYEKR